MTDPGDNVKLSKIEIIRNFFDDEFKDIEKDKLSQAYMFANFTKGDLQKLLKKLPEDTILNLDDLRIMFEAYCIEHSNKKNGFVLEALIAPILTGLCSGLAVLFFQQGILESSGAIKPEDKAIVTECKKQLDGKGYSELESLCSPLKNKFFQRADNETYNAIGRIIRGDKWDPKKGYRGKHIANKEVICPKLKEIDKLWKDASGGKLGFNAQRKVWDKTKKSYPAFTKDVGWKNGDGSWTIPSYDLEKVKNGHLPALWNQTHGDPNVGDDSGETDYKIFFDFIESCDLEKD
jgi:GUN4-like